MGRPVVISDLGRPVTVALSGFGEPLTIADNGYGEPVRVVNAWGQPVVIEDGDALALGADLLAWWDAAQGITVTGSGVSSWVDRKSGYTLAQATDANRPAYSATGFNGAPGLTFDGTTHRLSMESQPFPSGANPCEVWAVVQQDALAADATNRMVMAYGGATGLTARQTFRTVVTGTNRLGCAVGTGAAALTASNSNGEFSSRHVVRLAFGATSTDLSLDGGTAASLSATPSTGTVRVRVGSSQADTPAFFWQGKIRDVIVTNLLSAEKAAFLETFLLSRRAL